MRSYMDNGVGFDRSRAWMNEHKFPRYGDYDNVFTSYDTTRNNPSETRKPKQKKYVSVIPQKSIYINPGHYLPDRIEIRLCGTTQKRPTRWLSIPDLYRVTLHPKPSPVAEKPVSRLNESSLHCAHDASHDSFCLHSHRHDYMKEMYVSQYTHHFDSDAPRLHIAGWKYDVEPHGIPHRRSRMCVLNNPMVSGSRRLSDRPKSAPPNLALRFDDIFNEEITLVDNTLLESGPSRLESVRSTGNLSDHLKDLVIDEGKPFEYPTDDTSSIGYDPSDDTSDTSSAYLPSHKRRHSPQNLSLSRPRLLRLSAEFPGVRNLEKMRRKRQSMGSISTGSQSPTPSPTNGEYGFFVAVTSPPRNQKQQHWHRPQPQRPYSMS